MVVPSSNSMRTKKTNAVRIPTVDLSLERSELLELVIKACEQYGFFKAVNHGVPEEVISRLENEGIEFFSKSTSEKRQAGPAAPFGYGCRNIGPNGDMGDLEYLLLHTNPLSISDRSKTISNDPNNFSCAVNDYIEAVRELACEVVELVAEGLWVPDKYAVSKLIRDAHSDSVLRINHYPPTKSSSKWEPSIGFGEHSDPQILTILRSNEVGGLQICTQEGLWIPVAPDPTEFFVMVGDALQVMTNGRLRSVRHRVMRSTIRKGRVSTMYFAAPPPSSWITPLPKMVSAQRPSEYRPFTWAHYKQAAYSLRLGHSRLDLFRAKHPLLL
ncbi:gibberellin 2-beta-dioxygenase 2 [Prosopis cineraria]|uniref:gibberellin 2-beta-dioxygenase 2 n=1 Tax=Prosopis cineraria TaxID=364024 RepID=UPI00240F93D5|nr:gibberellin 2-beta-dioxygenase 2 [Prosopis cineraria]